jgi:hypothetical protein
MKSKADTHPKPSQLPSFAGLLRRSLPLKGANDIRNGNGDKASIKISIAQIISSAYHQQRHYT